MKKTLTAILVMAIVFVMVAFAYAGDVKYTKKTYIASIWEHQLDKACEVSSNDDKVAFMSMINNKLVFVMKEGIPVYIVEYSFPGKIKIRPHGSFSEFWTLSEAVQNDKPNQTETK